MNLTYNPKLKHNAQELRKNMTKEERKLWYEFLKGLSVNVYRQKVIKGYIVDFYIPQGKLVIELDGSQHYNEQGIEEDKVRDCLLRELGMTVLRYTNLEIRDNFKGVCEDIFMRIPKASF